MRVSIFALCFMLANSVTAQQFYGMVKVSEKLWVDDTEITNNEYRMFVGALSPEKQKEYLPDTTVWDDPSLTKFYYWHPAYDDYPVVGITHQQALAFCQWRTTLYLKEYPTSKVKFRLPTEQEWQIMAMSGLDETTSEESESSTKLEDYYAGGWLEAYTYGKGKKKKGLYFNFNFYQGEYGLGGIDGYFFTNTVKAFNKDLKAIYGLSGNVAEIVSEQGIAKGGSWKHTAEKCLVNAKIAYTKADPWLGFRCVVELLEE